MRWEAKPDDFDRNIYCLFGLPLDAMSMRQVLDRLHGAIEHRQHCFMSTPNLNFLITSLDNETFRDSVVNSDLSLADGMPLVMMARLLGIPIRRRIAGAGVFEALMAEQPDPSGPMSVFFFGGHDGVAEQACRNLRRLGGGGTCVGAYSPGFGSVEEMSGDDVIERINASGADFLVVSLGAGKGQAWIEHNRTRLTVPVMSHLGAVVNFAAGTIVRAPVWMQRRGAEWIWRIKEEPGLWRRYWRDGLELLVLAFGKFLPLFFWTRLHPDVWRGGGDARLETSGGQPRLVLRGTIKDPASSELRQQFRMAAETRENVIVDCAGASYLGPGAIGLLLMLRKQLNACERKLHFTGISPKLCKLFRLSGVEYLLDHDVSIAESWQRQCHEVSIKSFRRSP
jgi:N-acetylglucosaminyldiphosphoundecaprenol N-acetyl-beta-D-mannosaminyltransferase